MRTQEIRIGNYVFQNGKTTMVESIKSSLNDWSRINGLIYKSCEPVPLTEEWLLKFGFVKSTGWHDFEYFDKNGVHIYVCNDGNNEWFEYEMEFKVKSVHQLQNLYFALKNEELWLN